MSIATISPAEHPSGATTSYSLSSIMTKKRSPGTIPSGTWTWTEKDDRVEWADCLECPETTDGDLLETGFEASAVGASAGCSTGGASSFSAMTGRTSLLATTGTTSLVVAA
eukprot:Skav231544  [mRNA]  locus=scaffold84:752750:753082:+ [translate_table: standard]